MEPELQTVIFKTLSGDLTVEKQNDLLMMDFPSFPLKSVPVTEKMVEALGVKPVAAYYGADMVCDHAHCVTRTFAPKCNVAEDPVCGRGHCHVIPYWAVTTGKRDFKAYQASARGGVLYCSYEGERTILRGKAVLFAEAELMLSTL